MRHVQIFLIVCLAAGPSAAMQRPAASAQPGLTVDISFSPRAAAEMARTNRGFRVVAYYRGEPRPAFRRRAAEDGSITMGVEDIDVPYGTRRVVVTGNRFQRARINWVEEPTVDVNISTAGRRSGLNILDCTLITGSLAEVGGRVHPVRCALIGE